MTIEFSLIEILNDIYDPVTRSLRIAAEDRDTMEPLLYSAVEILNDVYDHETHRIRVSETTASGFTNPMTSSGDIIYAASGGVATRLPIGASGHVLTSNGSIPGWIAASSPTNTTDTLIFRMNPANVVKDGSNNVSATGDATWPGTVMRQASATLQPLYVAAPTGWNNQPCIRFDGSNDYLRAAISAQSIQAFTLAIVLAPRNTTAGGILSWDNTLGSNSAPYLIIRRNSTNVTFYLDGNDRYTIAHTTDVPKVYVLTFDGARYNLSVNDVPQTAYDTTGLPANITAGTSLMLGVGYNAYHNSDIGDIYLYNNCKSSSEVSTLAQSLKSKYGL